MPRVRSGGIVALPIDRLRQRQRRRSPMRWPQLSLLFIFCFAPAAAFAAETSKPAKEASDNPSVAVFEFNGPVTESQVEDPFDFDTQPVSLRELTRRLRAAGDDANVKAV